MAGQGVTEGDVRGYVPTVLSPGFVGRERELATLMQALASGPAVVLIEGEAGMGKTRLVQEFLLTPAAQEQQTLVATCPPFRQPSTLGPVVDAVRQATDGVARLRLSGLAGALRPLFPEWADELPRAPEPLEDATAARHRLFRALGELLGRLDVRLLVVEDVHWADEASMEFLLFLVSQRSQPASLLLTYRPEDVPAASLLRRLSSRLPAGTIRARITLAALDAAGTACLVMSMLPGGHVSEEFANFLCERTDGLPLAIEESIRLLLERADLTCRNGEWVRRELDELDVPPTVRDAVLERTGRLGRAARIVLRAAAVLADPASEAALAEVSALPPARARAGLSETLDCGLLTEHQPDGQGLISFRHVLAARAVYEKIPAQQRRELHLRAARMLEGQSPQPTARLARHFREAGEIARWCQYADEAADLALASGDDAMAAALLHELLTGADLPASAVVSLARKIPLHAIPRHAFLGDLARVLRSVRDDHAITAVRRAEIRFQLGRILMSADDHGAGAAELERAIPGLAHRPVEAARAMIMLGFPIGTLWPARVHRRWLDRAGAMAAGAPITAHDRLSLTSSRATALLLLGEEAGWSVAATLPEAAVTPQETHLAAVGYLNIGDAAVRWGRYDPARQWLITGLQLAQRHDYPRLRDMALVTLAQLDWLTGNWSGLAGRAAALASLDDVDPAIRLEAALVTELLEGAADASGSAEGSLRSLLGKMLEQGVADAPLATAAALARLALKENRAKDALALTDEPMKVITAKEIWLWASDVAPVRVQALTAIGCFEEARRLVTAFARGLRGRNAPAARAAQVICSAILAEGLGEGRAAALFARAATAWEGLPRPYDALLARERQGRCLLAAGQDEKGLAALSGAFQGLSRLGARGDAGRVMGMLRDNGVKARRPGGGRQSYGDRLSPRELEVVSLLVTGRTDREMAETLFLSPKTVARHLDSARRKLNVPSRIALAVAAVEAGIVSGQPGTGAA